MYAYGYGRCSAVVRVRIAQQVPVVRRTVGIVAVGTDQRAGLSVGGGEWRGDGSTGVKAMAILSWRGKQSLWKKPALEPNLLA